MSPERTDRVLIRRNLADRLERSSMVKYLRGQIPLEEYNRRLEILYPFTKIDLRALAMGLKREASRRSREKFISNVQGVLTDLFGRGSQAS